MTEVTETKTDEAGRKERTSPADKKTLHFHYTSTIVLPTATTHWSTSNQISVSATQDSVKLFAFYDKDIYIDDKT